MKISVAMATYNGARFLRAQLNSLADQSHMPAELVVGDDGSTDATIEILEEFRKRAAFPVHIQRNETNLGYARNFLATAQRCQGDWVAFCDQDDVWLPNKLADAARAMAQAPDCCMILQNAWLCDETLASRNLKIPGTLRPGLHLAGARYGFWVWHGFLQTIEKSLFDLWDDDGLPRNYYPQHPEISHDKWTCMIANALGGMVVIKEPAALYRRHDSALTGGHERPSLGARVVKARSVSAEHYRFLADVAAECVLYMGRLSERTQNPKWASAFRDGARNFQSLQKTQHLRSQLYAGRRFAERLHAFTGILRKGGYFGAPFTAMGARSAAKDAVRVVFGKT